MNNDIILCWLCWLPSSLILLKDFINCTAFVMFQSAWYIHSIASSSFSSVFPFLVLEKTFFLGLDFVIRSVIRKGHTQHLSWSVSCWQMPGFHAMSKDGLFQSHFPWVLCRHGSSVSLCSCSLSSSTFFKKNQWTLFSCFYLYVGIICQLSLYFTATYIKSHFLPQKLVQNFPVFSNIDCYQ